MGLRSDGPGQSGADITSVSMAMQEERRWLAGSVWLTGRGRERERKGARGGGGWEDGERTGWGGEAKAGRKSSRSDRKAAACQEAVGPEY